MGHLVNEAIMGFTLCFLILTVSFHERGRGGEESPRCEIVTAVLWSGQRGILIEKVSVRSREQNGM